MATDSTAEQRDLGPCPRASDGCKGRLVALISDDGSAFEAEVCTTCWASWWNDVPLDPPEGVKQVRQRELDAARRERDAAAGVR